MKQQSVKSLIKGKTFVRRFTKNDIVSGYFTSCDFLDVIPKLEYEKNSNEPSKD